MSPWDIVSRWTNAFLLVIVGFIGFDTLFYLLEANEANVIVAFAGAGAGFFLAPFQGMFEDQDTLLTALVAVLGYALLVGVVLAVTRAVQASVRRRALRAGRRVDWEHPQAPPPPPAAPAREATTLPGGAELTEPDPAVAGPPAPPDDPDGQARFDETQRVADGDEAPPASDDEATRPIDRGGPAGS
ncbi:MAG: hypothetical protein R6T85_05710 [Egibacteraceae bacterium]